MFPAKNVVILLGAVINGPRIMETVKGDPFVLYTLCVQTGPRKWDYIACKCWAHLAVPFYENVELNDYIYVYGQLNSHKKLQKNPNSEHVKSIYYQDVNTIYFQVLSRKDKYIENINTPDPIFDDLKISEQEQKDFDTATQNEYAEDKEIPW